MAVTGKGSKLDSAWLLRGRGRGLLLVRPQLQWGDKDPADGTLWSDWFFEPSGAAPVAYSMAGASGSYSVVGGTASLKVARALPVAFGTVLTVGSASVFHADKQLSLSAGSVVVTGQTADFVYSAGHTNYQLAASAGTYDVTGGTVELKAHRNTTAGTGIILVQGGAGAFSKQAFLTAANGIIVTAGNVASFNYVPVLPNAYELEAERGLYACEGYSAQFDYIPPQMSGATLAGAHAGMIIPARSTSRRKKEEFAMAVLL